MTTITTTTRYPLDPSQRFHGSKGFFTYVPQGGDDEVDLRCVLAPYLTTPCLRVSAASSHPTSPHPATGKRCVLAPYLTTPCLRVSGGSSHPTSPRPASG